jgi:hypothetical protein
MVCLDGKRAQRMVRLASIIIAVLGMVIAWNVTPPAEKRILFIGNSYTFGGQIPEQLRRIAATSDPPAKYLVKSHVRAGTSLSQHIAETGALEAIRAQDWDVVVLQDASRMSFRPDWRDEMRQAAEALATAAQRQGAKVLYFAHWAPRGQSRAGDADLHIARTYEDLAARTGGQVAKAGLLWHLSSLAGVRDLYAEDDHHATLKGGYVAAMAFADALGDVDPSTATWHPDQISPSERELVTTIITLSAERADLPGG